METGAENRQVAWIFPPDTFRRTDGADAHGRIFRLDELRVLHSVHFQVGIRSRHSIGCGDCHLGCIRAEALLPLYLPDRNAIQAVAKSEIGKL